MRVFITTIILTMFSTIWISSGIALANLDCNAEPNTCEQCKWLLTNCDLPAQYTPNDASTNPDNPCYPWCNE